MSFTNIDSNMNKRSKRHESPPPILLVPPFYPPSFQIAGPEIGNAKAPVVRDGNNVTDDEENMKEKIITDTTLVTMVEPQSGAGVVIGKIAEATVKCQKNSEPDLEKNVTTNHNGDECLEDSSIIAASPATQPQEDILSTALPFPSPGEASPEFDLYYLCFSVLGPRIWKLTTLQSVVDAVLDAILFALRGSNRELHQPAIITLQRISAFPQTQSRTYSKLKEVIRKFMESEDLDSVSKQSLTEGVRNLSRCVSNKVPIYQHLLPSLINSLRSGEDLHIQRFAIGALNNLATSDENAVGLIRHPEFMIAVLTLVKTGSSPTIKERAIWTLQSLASADINEVPLYDVPDVIPTLVHCLQFGETIEIQCYSLEALRNLASQNRQRLFANRKLIGLLLHLCLYGKNTRVKMLSVNCFERMGFDKGNINSLQLLTTLVSVREVPKVCLKTCLFRVIPKELIRKMASTLFVES